MGCCASTSNASPPSKHPRIPNPAPFSISKSPPPSDEESVKEVLSETKHPSLIIPNNTTTTNNHYPFIKTAPLLPSHHFTKPRLNSAAGIKTPPYNEPSEDFSEIASSLSESLSVSASVNEELHTHHHVRHKSPARIKNRALSGEVKRERNAVGRSPGRRSDPSPNRVMNGSGSGYGRRMDGGESSGRRSRSPVTRADQKTGLSQSGSGRKTGKSPRRVGPGSGERVRRVEDGGKGSEGSGKWPPTSNESLENPLVSLECFIFL